MSRCPGLPLLLVLLIPLFPLRASAQPTVAVVVEIDKSPALQRAAALGQKVEDDGSVGEVFYDEVRTNGGVTLASRLRTSSIWKTLSGSRYSDKKVAALATGVEVVYGLHVFVSLEPEKPGSKRSVLGVKARVVRKDGLVAIEEKQKTRLVEKSDPRSLLAQIKPLAHDLVGELSLGTLSANEPSPQDLPPNVVQEQTTPNAKSELVGLSQPPPPPPLIDVVKRSEPSVLRPIGYAGIAVGGAAIVAGVVVFAMTPKIHQDSSGNVLPQDASAFRPAQAQQAAGVGLMIGGGVVAAAGAVAAFWLGHDAPLSAAIVPAANGGSLVVGGGF